MYEDIVISDSVKEQLNLKGQKALITGGAGFLGLQFAEAIHEMGGMPVLVDNNNHQLKTAKKHLQKTGVKNYKSYMVDITDEKKCIKVFNRIWKRHYYPILVNLKLLQN